MSIVKSAKGPTPAPTSHPSRPSFDNVTDTFIHMLLEAPQDHQSAKKLAFIRDGYRCVISGRTDARVYETNADVRAAWDAAVLLDPSMRLASTTCAHIFPESINRNIIGENEGGHKHQYAASVWAVMERFGQVLGVDELNGADIHRMRNVMTMERGLHDLFDSLGIWFEATPTVNRYNVRGKYAAYTMGIQNPITFPTNGSLPAPDPRYLKLHAACAQVAHLSGAGEYIDNILRDMETTRVLAKDGSSSDLLNFRLLDAQVA
ncbi:hypothetical protein PILCRDRAFT_731746 [Piloderma croceum F 1598]|uniref:HNH nuclease domain-containing protein n=1 Tax=Piloderma croceum (strain F 1598) TaxID=765440 RepID=A0A0C3EZ68_PILCF|nr:hypothetical protein PILCRDRAFT_731746 [Piloderma croceum F 1598]